MNVVLNCQLKQQMKQTWVCENDSIKNTELNDINVCIT